MSAKSARQASGGAGRVPGSGWVARVLKVARSAATNRSVSGGPVSMRRTRSTRSLARVFHVPGRPGPGTVAKFQGEAALEKPGRVGRPEESGQEPLDDRLEPESVEGDVPLLGEGLEPSLQRRLERTRVPETLCHAFPRFPGSWGPYPLEFLHHATPPQPGVFPERAQQLAFPGE